MLASLRKHTLRSVPGGADDLRQVGIGRRPRLTGSSLVDPANNPQNTKGLPDNLW